MPKTNQSTSMPENTLDVGQLLNALEKLMDGIKVRVESDFLVQYATLWARLPLTAQKLFWVPFLAGMDQDCMKAGDKTTLNLQFVAAFIGLDPRRNPNKLRYEVKVLAIEIKNAIRKIAKEKGIANYKRHPHPFPAWEMIDKETKDDNVVIAWKDCSMFLGFFHDGTKTKNYVEFELQKFFHLEHKLAMAHFFLIASGRGRKGNGYEYNCSTEDLYAISDLEPYQYYNGFPKQLDGYYTHDIKLGQVAAKPQVVYTEWQRGYADKTKNKRNTQRSIAEKYEKPYKQMAEDMKKIKPHLNRWNFEEAVFRPALEDCIRAGLLHIIPQDDVFHPREETEGKSQDIIRKKYQNKTKKGGDKNYYRLLENGKHYNILMSE